MKHLLSLSRQPVPLQETGWSQAQELAQYARTGTDLMFSILFQSLTGRARRRKHQRPFQHLEAVEARILPAATLTRFESPEGSPEFTEEFVRMNLGDFIVDFDTRFGGTPSRWFYNGVPVTDPFPGTGVTVMWDQGNDPTQASASGHALHPVARLDGRQLEYNYYIREQNFGSGPVPGSVEYTIRGFAPFFWISNEAPDDAIPSESRIRWRTRYKINPSDENEVIDPLVLGDPSLPVDYVASGSPDGAILMIGDDFVKPELPWYQRLAEMREGRVAAKVRVSLGSASSDAVASLMFRRSVPKSGTVTEASAYGAPGYSLNVNKSGDVQIVRVATQGAPGIVVWSAPGVAASTINTGFGSVLELRTNNASANVEIFLNDQKIGDYNDTAVIQGAHFGLFAQCSTGRIRFADRRVFDVGTEFIARYTGFSNGVLESDIEIRNADPVNSPNHIYFAQAPSVWLNNGLKGSAVARVYDAAGRMAQEYNQGAVAWEILRGENSDPQKVEPYALWLGSTTTNAGLFAIPQNAWVNGQPASDPHAQIDVNNEGRFTMALNPLPSPPFPPQSQSARFPVTSTRMVTHWRPRLEQVAPLRVSVSDASVAEGDSGNRQMTFQVSLNRQPTQIVSVDYATAGNTAASGIDFSAGSGRVTFDPADGILTKTVTVSILGDQQYEAAELLQLILSSPTHAGPGDATGIGTILNDDVLASPVVTQPAATTTARRPVIRWNSVTGASRYEVTVDDLNGGVRQIVSVSTTTPEYTPDFDLGIGSFRTRIRAIAANGDVSAWSSPLSFLITTPVTLNALTRRQTTHRPVISWAPLPGAVRYDLQIANASTGEQQYIRRSSLTQLSYTPESDLPLGLYRVSVRGVDSAGRFARWSEAMSFVVAVPPVLTAPGPSTFDRTPAARWNALPGAVAYRVMIRNLLTSSVVSDVSGITSLSWSPSTTLPDGPYRFLVAGAAQNGTASNWSTPKDVYVGGRPSLISPQGTTGSAQIRFSWTPVDLARSFHLTVNRNDGANSNVINRTGLTGSGWTSTTSLAAGSYRAWVRAVSTSGEISLWSQPVDFTVAASEVPVSQPDLLELESPIAATLRLQPATQEVPARTSAPQPQGSVICVADDSKSEPPVSPMVVLNLQDKPGQARRLIEPENAATNSTEDRAGTSDGIG